MHKDLANTHAVMNAHEVSYSISKGESGLTVHVLDMHNGRQLHSQRFDDPTTAEAEAVEATMDKFKSIGNQRLEREVTVNERLIDENAKLRERLAALQNVSVQPGIRPSPIATDVGDE